MEEHESADPRGPERAPEPSAATPFESREASAPSHAAPETGYTDKPSEGAPSQPASDSREGRGGYRDRGFRDRGGRGRGGRGRRPPPRRQGGGGGGYDRPARAEDSARPAESDEFRDTPPPRSYEDEPEERERISEEADAPRDYEGAPEAAGDDRSESEEFAEERTDADRELIEEREYDREPARSREPERDRDRGGRGDRGREPYERRDRDRDRGDRGGGRRDDRYDRDRNVYRSLRGQIDRIRHSLETVLRDMERVLQTLSQAEHDQTLTEQELEGLRKQIEDMQRGGHRGGYDRHRRHDEER